MLERDWFWPRNIISKISATIIAVLFLFRFIPNYQELAFDSLSVFTIIVSITGILFFLLFLFLGYSKQREIAYTIPLPFLGYWLIFSFAYWIFGINSELNFNIVSTNAEITWMSYLILCSGIDIYIQIRDNKLDKESFHLFKAFDIRFRTLPYISRVLFPVILLGFVFATVSYIIVAIKDNNYNQLIEITPIFLLAISLFIIVYNRQEKSFFALLLITFTSLVVLIVLGSKLTIWTAILIYFYILIGICAIYTLEKTFHLVFFSIMIALPGIISITLDLSNQLSGNLFEKIIFNVLIPLITSVIGAILGYVLSKKNFNNEESDYFILLNQEEHDEAQFLKQIKQGKIKGIRKGNNIYILKSSKEELKNQPLNT